MPQNIHVHLLPVLFQPDDVRGATAVIVDVLRASTTISFALQNGAAGVIPCGTVDDAMALRRKPGTHACLLGGERGGVKIDGFDLSNSPDDYRTDTVTGRTIAFTTTNGTNALIRAQQAQSIFIGTFVCLTSVVAQLRETDGPIHIVCAGTDGAITSEDVLFAGALSHELLTSLDAVAASDATDLAVNHWQQECGERSTDRIVAALERSQGGKNLTRLGYGDDIVTAGQLDTVDRPGIVNSDGVIRLAADRSSDDKA